jgi:hypothetical protein
LSEKFISRGKGNAGRQAQVLINNLAIARQRLTLETMAGAAVEQLAEAA